MEPLSRDQRVVLVSMIILIALGIFASDLYLPSLPAMTIALHTSHEAVKMTISIYLFGLACSPLIFGPLSDRYGRRPILLMGLVVAFVGSVICVLSHSINVLIFGRFIQATGVASGLTLGRTIASDVFQGAALSRIGSYMGMLFGIVPAVAPVLGGYVQKYFGWRANFELILLLIVATFVWVIFIVPETSKKRARHAIRPKILIKTYWSLISHKQFIVYPLFAALIFSCFMIYLTISPFLFQEVMGYTPVQFGWLAVIISAGIMTGSFINVRFVKSFSGTTLIIVSSIIMLTGSLVMLLFALAGILNFYVVMIPMFMIAVGIQLGFSNAFSGGMSKITIAAGFATALFTSIQMGGASFANSVASMLHIRNQIPLAIMLSTVCSVALVLVYFGIKRVA